MLSKSDKRDIELMKQLKKATSVQEILETAKALNWDFSEQEAREFLGQTTQEGGGALKMTKELEMSARLSDTTDREEAISLAMELFGMTRERAEEATDEALKMYKKI